MRIAIMGQGAFGAAVLEKMLNRKEKIVAVWLPQGPSQKADLLKIAAENHEIPTFQPESYKTAETLDLFRITGPDLLIMAFVTDIIPLSLLEVPIRGAICYHPSLLPRHRGGSAINWAVIMGDGETGLSIFWADAGIDTGPILLQKRIHIGSEDTAGSLYFNHLFPLGIEAIAESVDLIKAGSAPRITQDEKSATYEPLCNDRIARIDWEKSAAELYNQIRGCDPQPGAYSFYRGMKIRFFDSRLIDAGCPGALPGTVLFLDRHGFAIAVQDGAIHINKIRIDSGKQAASTFAEAAAMQPGDIFRAN